MRYIHQGVAKDGNGKVIREATVSVYLAGTTTPATVYAGESGGGAINEVTTDSVNGSFEFWVDTVDYTSVSQNFKIIISKTSFNPKTFDDLVIFNGDITTAMPEWFGAVGDGVTDDLSAITNMITFVNTLGGNVIIEFQPKRYYCSEPFGMPALNVGNLTINGNGAEIFSSTTRAGSGQFININDDNVYRYNYIIRDLKITNSRIANESKVACTPITITSGENILIDNVTLYNPEQYGINIKSNNTSNNVKDVTIRNTKIQYCYQLPLETYADTSGSGTIENLKIEGCYFHLGVPPTSVFTTLVGGAIMKLQGVHGVTISDTSFISDIDSDEWIQISAGNVPTGTDHTRDVNIDNCIMTYFNFIFSSWATGAVGNVNISNVVSLNPSVRGVSGRNYSDITINNCNKIAYCQWTPALSMDKLKDVKFNNCSFVDTDCVIEIDEVIFSNCDFMEVDNLILNNQSAKFINNCKIGKFTLSPVDTPTEADHYIFDNCEITDRFFQPVSSPYTEFLNCKFTQLSGNFFSEDVIPNAKYIGNTFLLHSDGYPQAMSLHDDAVFSRNTVYQEPGGGALTIFFNSNDFIYPDNTFNFNGSVNATVLDYAGVDGDKGLIGFVNGDATPSVANGSKFHTLGSTSITTFDDGYDGKEITVVAYGNITVVDGATMRMAGNIDYNMTLYDSLTMIYDADGALWIETGRGVN